MGKRVLIGILVAVVLFIVCIVVAIAVGAGALFTAVSGPNDAVNRYYEAVRANNWQTAYDQLAPSFQQRVTVQDLQQAFEQEASTNGAITDVSITNTSVNNDQATVEADVNRERQNGSVTVNLVKEGEVWKIAGFGGS